ncbi:MAG: hypothetical protein IJE29_02990 [Firmicutes bacterium]|nr:hypothetical protein [Bacillota bacterium]
MKKNFLLFGLVVVSIMILCSSANAISREEVIEYTNYTQSIYYEDLKKAYEEYSQKAYEQKKFVEIPLEVFVCEYSVDDYASVNAYLEEAISELQYSTDQADIQAQVDANNLLLQQHFAAVENTRLAGGAWYYNCPELAKDNAYGYYDLLGDQVATGDIVLDGEGVFGLIGHNALVVGHFYSNIFQTYYVRVIEAIDPVVSYGILCDQRVVERDSSVYRISTTTTKRSNALSFAKNQLGESYNYDILLDGYGSLDISSNRTNWYCSLLCYAAYKNYGIDIADKISIDEPLYPKYIVQSSTMTECDIGRND